MNNSWEIPLYWISLIILDSKKLPWSTSGAGSSVVMWWQMAGAGGPRVSLRGYPQHPHFTPRRPAAECRRLRPVTPTLTWTELAHRALHGNYHFRFRWQSSFNHDNTVNWLVCTVRLYHHGSIARLVSLFDLYFHGQNQNRVYVSVSNAKWKANSLLNYVDRLITSSIEHLEKHLLSIIVTGYYLINNH